MMPQKWTDPFLDHMRRQGDTLADTCVAQLHAEHGITAVNALFKTMRVNSAPLPADTLPVLRSFFDQSAALPEPLDRARIRHGEDTFMQHAFPAALVLLAKSLPTGYAAPNLSLVLNLSGDLIRQPYKRVLGVLQMVVDVSSRGGFEPGGDAVVTTQKLRLLHAGVRHIVRNNLPQYESQYEVPVNQEDMLGTIMGFSYLVIVGLRQLELGLSHDDEEDFFYLWCLCARMMGIHPEYIPESVADAQAFYDAFMRRHYVPAAVNPDGVALAAADLRMLQHLIPRLLYWLGLRVAPRIYMQELIGREGCARIGIRPVMGHVVLKWLLQYVPALWQRPLEAATAGTHHAEAFSRMIFQGMIHRAYNGDVTFIVPDTLTDLQQMA